MGNNGEALTEPITALIVRTVKPEHVKEFEDWIGGMNQITRKFEGFLGVNMIRPINTAHSEYVIIVRFDNYEHLRSFMTSTERKDYLLKSESMTEGELSVQEMSGMESFFALPGTQKDSLSPPRYKMAILTILVLYPTLLGLSTLIAFIFHGFPRPLLILITLVVLVPIMTYFIMPWVTRLFRFWLYPGDMVK
ncbi:MAG: antibiotic biosynthesis monooxygenase [Anaerolineaceae bacterium]